MLSLPKYLPALLQLAPLVFDETNKLRIKPNLKQREYLKQHRAIFKLQEAFRVLDIPRRKAWMKIRRPRADDELV